MNSSGFFGVNCSMLMFGVGIFSMFGISWICVFRWLIVLVVLMLCVIFVVRLM